MTEVRRAQVWGLVAARAATQGRHMSAADICAITISLAQVTGAWVTAASTRGPDFVMSVTNPVSEQLAELQLTVGEGPCRDMLAIGAPVLTSDLEEEEPVRRWPGFTPAAQALGARAVFAFPLSIGVIRAGVLGMYRSEPGPLAATSLRDCLLLADMATVLLLDAVGPGADGSADGNGARLDGQAAELALHRAEIDQATGMLTVQLGVTAGEAFARLRAYAYTEERRLADVAGDIVARRLRLHPDPALGGES
jgi:hypothetical protein